MVDQQTQKDLSQPVNGYQLQLLQKDINTLTNSFEKELGKINVFLENINTQTKGVVTYEQMTDYVDKRFDEKIKLLENRVKDLEENEKDRKSDVNKIKIGAVAAIISSAIGWFFR